MCLCDNGYAGDMCESCDSKFYQIDNESEEEGSEKPDMLECKGQLNSLHDNLSYMWMQNVIDHVISRVMGQDLVTATPVPRVIEKMMLKCVKVRGKKIGGRGGEGRGVGGEIIQVSMSYETEKII